MLEWVKDILTLLVFGIVCLGIGKNDNTWVWSIKKLKQNWSKLWPLTKQKNNCLMLWRAIKQRENWLKLGRAIGRFLKIAIVIGIVIALLWALFLLGLIFIHPIQITNGVLLVALIFLGWIIINALRQNSGETLQEISELKDKIAELELKLDEHLE